MGIDEEKLSRRIRRQHNLYINSLTSKCNHNIQRVIKEISYGMLAKNSALLSDIGRSLNESVSLRVTINRLSENLFENFHDRIEQKYMNAMRDYVSSETIIAVDDGDIAKPRAKALEGLDYIWDGSIGEKEKGYPLFVSVAVNKNRDEVIPILIRLFSRKDDAYKSDNHAIEEYVKQLLNTYKTKPTYVFDRGFCSISRMKFLDDYGVLFVMRARERTAKNEAGVAVDVFSWARALELPYSTNIVSIRNGKELQQKAWYRVEPLTIEGLEVQSVIMRIESHDICILFTNRRIGNMKYAAFGAEIISIYGHRWSIEEYNRFIKQILDFENIRVQNLVSIRNMVAITTITAGFISHIGFLRKSLHRMTMKLIEIGKPLREEVRFPHYRISAAIKVLFERRIKPAFAFKNRHKPEPTPIPLLDGLDDKT